VTIRLPGRSRPAGAGRAEPPWERALRALAQLVSERQPPIRVCHDCAVDYVPELTGGRCPICGAGAEGGALVVRGARRRDLAGLGLAWLIAVVVFLLIAHALYG
jgi:hypothetical protein